MKLIPAGAFRMGAGDDDKFAGSTERPARRVTVEAFQLAIAPVTVAQYRCFDENAEGKDDWPVSSVSWRDARTYCDFLSNETGQVFRLPDEAEWEYACRAGTETPFWWGNAAEPFHANFLYDENGNRAGVGSRTSVGRYAANAFGLFDMLGNVCEWTADAWRPNYGNGNADSAVRVIRGGAWDYMPRLLRCAWRDGLGAEVRRDNVGFRVALDED